jgi:hypothetical protein
VPRTITIHAGEASAAAEGRTFQQLAELADDAQARGDYRAAHVLCMAGALVATSRAEEDEAIAGASWALDRALVYQPDPLPPVPEAPAVQQPVLLDWSIPVYRVDAQGRHVAGPWYGDAPAGASWKRAGARPA